MSVGFGGNRRAKEEMRSNRKEMLRWIWLYLPTIRRVTLIHLHHKPSSRVSPQRPKQLRLNRCQPPQHRRVLHLLRIMHTSNHGHGISTLTPADTHQNRNIGVEVVQTVRVRSEVLVGCRAGTDGEAAPEAALRESTDVEARDDAEVVGAAFEGEPEVWVGGAVGGDDAAVAEDDFVGEDVVADEAFAGAEEGDSPCRGHLAQLWLEEKHAFVSNEWMYVTSYLQ